MYNNLLNLIETQAAIKKIKDYFENNLALKLSLTRVSAPICVTKSSGLNDNLTGIEHPVSFMKDNEELEIVQSLAKWKRKALKDYNFEIGRGLYTDMNAIRKDEKLDNVHSIYVDQWDWEKIINESDRNEMFLRETVIKIYESLKETENYVKTIYHGLINHLPDEIYFITTEELLNLYPHLTAKEREYEICKKYGAVFLMKIGDKLSNGDVHDFRSPDYDDWTLNGDILVFNKIINNSFELSSMGIRVNSNSLKTQLEKANALDRLSLPYHQAVINSELPFTIGGGIGQSRMCMFFLDKIHIGEVQASYWDESEIERCKKEGIKLL